MKNRNKIFQILFIIANVLFWIFWIIDDTGECFYRPGFYIHDFEMGQSSLMPCLVYTLGTFLPFIIMIYCNWLLLIPKYLAKRMYLKYFVGVCILVIITAVLLYFYGGFDHENYLKYNDGTNEEKIAFVFPAIFDGIGAALMALIFTTPFYFSYHWFVQQNKIVQLENEQLNTELALLKGQIHPHFFFNTLNNLYALTLEESKAAPDMILKLSDLMRYTIYNGKKKKVPLKEELECMENFLNLQKIRHHRDVDIQFNQEVSNPNIEISPLLFIVFLENAFKHGVEILRKESYVHIKLIASDKQIYFEIVNNYDAEEIVKNGGGLGLENIKRRLALSYPNRHEIYITNDKNTFKVNLHLDLI